MKKKRKRINNTVDLILLIIFLFAGLYFTVEAFFGGVFPHQYVWLALALTLMLSVGIFFTFKVRNSFFRSCRKAVLVLLSVVLIFGAVFQGQLRRAFQQIDNGSTSVIQMYVMTRKDSKLDDFSSVSTVGYVNQESELLTYCLNETDKMALTKISYESMDEELKALNSNEVDAVLISALDKSLAETINEDYFNDYKILHTFKMRVQNDIQTSSVDMIHEPFVVYVSGLDDMGEPTIAGHSDVNMLLMIDPINHHVNILSINRDTYVPNPQYDDYPDKLTHLGWIGPLETAMTLEKVFGIQIDFFAKVTFESLIQIIDTLGGIDVDVQLDFCEQDEYRSFESSDLICLNKGLQHLDGSSALAYARHRKTSGWEVKGREQAQRDIIQAIVHRLLSFEGIMKAGDVMNVAAQYVSTNMPMDSAKAFLNHAIQSKAAWTFESVTIDSMIEASFPCATGGGISRSAVLLKESDIQMVHDLYISMFDNIKLHDFAFDLNDMEKYMSTFRIHEKVVTYEHYEETILEYFPTYYRNYYE